MGTDQTLVASFLSTINKSFMQIPLGVGKPKQSSGGNGCKLCPHPTLSLLIFNVKCELENQNITVLYVSTRTWVHSVYSCDEGVESRVCMCL